MEEGGAGKAFREGHSVFPFRLCEVPAGGAGLPGRRAETAATSICQQPQRCFSLCGAYAWAYLSGETCNWILHTCFPVTSEEAHVCECLHTNRAHLSSPVQGHVAFGASCDLGALSGCLVTQLAVSWFIFVNQHREQDLFPDWPEGSAGKCFNTEEPVYCWIYMMHN